ncbi:hypothetical protein [Streptomyces sp. 2A115]
MNHTSKVLESGPARTQVMPRTHSGHRATSLSSAEAVAGGACTTACA